MSFSKETIEKFKKFEKDIITINDYISKIGELKAQVVDPRADKIKQKPIWNLESYIQLAIHRVYDLAIQSTNAWNIKIPVVAFILTRAIYENTAYMYDLSEKILLYYKKDDYIEMHKLVLNRLVGTRLGSNTRQIVNVLTAINSVTKEVPDFKEFYEFISDFCHPNYSGMLGIYGKLDQDNVRFFVGKEHGYTEETFSFIITGLTTGLGIFYNSSKNLVDNIDELNEFYYKHQPLASDK
jgi:hypothetical protein